MKMTRRDQQELKKAVYRMMQEGVDSINRAEKKIKDVKGRMKELNTIIKILESQEPKKRGEL